MKSFKKRMAAIILSVCLIFTLLPGSVFAASDDDMSGVTQFVFSGSTVTVYEKGDTKYEVLVYTSADDDTTYSPVSNVNADGSTTYTLPDGISDTAAELRVAIKKSGGSYAFSGSGTGSIAVKKEATAPAVLYLNSLTLTSSLTSPITVNKASTSSCTVYAVKGTVNTLTDSEFNNADVYGAAEDGGNGENLSAESAVIKGKSNAQLILTGEGTLNLVCNTKNAVKVAAYGSLTVEKLTLNITSSGHGLSSDNTLTVNSGTVEINASGDGIRSNPDAVDAQAGCEGNVILNGGTVKIKAGSDGVQASQDLTVTGGSFDITTLGGYNDKSFNSSTMSCKGFKASGNDDETEDADNTISVTGGTFVFNTADDAVHSDGYISITGGVFTIKTGDDGVHSDTSLTLGTEGGGNVLPKITVESSYEGLEAGSIYIYSGNYSVASSDDGINAAGGSSSGTAGGGNENFNPGGWPSWPWGGSGGGAPGQGTSTGDYKINIYGGKIYVNADGDGLDSNGDLSITGGTIVVWGQKKGGDNAPLDSDGTLTVKGATVFAAGSSAMKELPSSSTSQPYVYSTSGAATGKTINVKYSGTTVYNIIAVKDVNFILYSSPSMASSSNYSIVINTDALIETEDDSCESVGHTWDNGVVTLEPTCTEQGIMTYTCAACSETKTQSIPATGHSYQNGYCTGCGEENPNENWYTVTFSTDENCSVTTYLTQNTSDVDSYNATAAIARDGATGKKLVDGDGQINFSVSVRDGYELVSVCADKNYKNLKVVDEASGLYRITKITGDVCVEITTQKKACTEHQWDEGVVTVAPTETATGIMTYTCTVCGETVTQTIPATGVITTSSIIKSVTYETDSADGTVTVTVVTSPAAVDRLKISLASSTSSYLKYTNGFTVNENGDCVWTMKISAPQETTQYAIDARSTETNRYFRDYYLFTVEAQAVTSVIKSVSAQAVSGKLVFTVETLPSVNRVKLADASILTGYIKYTDSYTVSDNGNYIWTLKIDEPSESAEYAVDARSIETGRYLREYNYYTYQKSAEDGGAIVSVFHRLSGSNIVFTVETKPTVNRVKLADASVPTGYIKYTNSYTENENGNYVWEISISAPLDTMQYVFDARSEQTGRYLREYVEYTYTPTENVSDIKSVSAEVNGDSIVFTIVTSPIFNRVKVADAGIPTGYLGYTSAYTVLDDGSYQWLVTVKGSSDISRFVVDGRLISTNRYALNYFEVVI